MEMKTTEHVKRFSSSVIQSAIQEVEGKSYITNGNKVLLTKATLLDTKLGLKPKNYDKEIGFTSLALIPGPQVGLDNSHFGIIVQFQGKAVDTSQRDAVMTSVLVMPQNEGLDFISVCKDSPEVLYETLKTVNGGSIKSAHGNMDIRHGENIRIVANNKVGGTNSIDQTSSNFDLNYICNQ